MAGHSIYIDCAENMAELMATYPSELTDGVDLHMGDPSPEEVSEIMSGYKGVLNGHTVMPKPLLEAHVGILRSIVFLGTGVANYIDPAAGEALEGTSLAPLFDDPARASVKDAAVSQFGKCELTSVNNKFHRNQTALMGYSVRVESWRYTAWFAFDNTSIVPLTAPEHSLGAELYDHRGDSGLWLDWPGENRNLVSAPEHAAIVAELHQRVLDYIQLRPVL